VILLEKIEVILSIAGTILGLAVTALTFIVKFAKTAKAKRWAQQFVKISNAIVPYIEQAEKFSHYSGAEKKEFVITKVNRFAIENGLEFNATEISAKIEEFVTLSKQINMRDKDKYVSMQKSAVIEQT
jgi:hypothetical protein